MFISIFHFPTACFQTFVHECTFKNKKKNNNLKKIKIKKKKKEKSRVSLPPKSLLLLLVPHSPQGSAPHERDAAAATDSIRRKEPRRLLPISLLLSRPKP
jgi:hypothetical protein